jgi:uncharacterized membrane protein
MLAAPFIKLYALTLCTCLTIDLTWIGLIAKNFYQKHLGYLMNENFNLPVGLLFYALFALALVIFVIAPAQEKQSLQKALMLGFFFGLVTYSAYDLTNQATIKDWPMIVTIIDMLWGASMAAATSGITFYIASKLNFFTKL